MKQSNVVILWLEAAVVWVFALFVTRLPRRGVVSFARGLGNLAFRISRRERRIALANVDLVFGSSRTASAKEEIVRGSFRTMAQTMLDLIWFQHRTAERLERHVHRDETYPHYRDSKPGVVVTAHYCNWEVMGLAGGLLGEPCNSVATPLKNPYVDKMLLKARRFTGQGVVPRKGAVKALIRVLRNRGRAAFLLDQNTLPEEGGRFVEFFGRMVPVSIAAEMLAERTGAAVVFAYSEMDAEGDYYAHFRPPFHARKDAGPDGSGVTERLTTMLEEQIRERPELWLWMYKRWKFVPSGEAIERYPYYARCWKPKE